MLSNLRKTTLTLGLAAAAAGTLLIPAAEAHAMPVAIGVSINIAPPALPIYAQPPLPAPGYIWTPGYWAWGPAGYFWVPGTWVEPPTVGVLWTPAWWGWEGGAYLFHAGYWGPHVGFYGGINYGFGYGGVGFFGGAWRGGVFAYNGAVANFGGVHVTNVYVDRTVVVHNTIINNNHVAFNGGPNGINRMPNAQEQQWSHEQHMQPTQNQMQHQNFASQDRAQLASVNGGRPGTFATQNNAAYHQVAQQHMQSQPISQADRQTGQHFNTANVNSRQANQDQRISNGLRSGQMTSGEAAQADRTQRNIDQQVRNDRTANGGQLTGQQRQQIGQEQNAASRQIYNDNHNANSVRPNAVDNREANQEQRIANGQRSGQMTSGEAARAQNRQQGVDQQVHNDRTANGGAMNQQQRQQVNREQNKASKQIAKENHNDNKR